MEFSLRAIAVFLFSGLSGLALAGSVEMAFELSPAGSFVAKTSAIKGFGQVAPGGKHKLSPVTLDMRRLDTGIELRDKHLREKLETKKYPMAKITRANVKNGKGKAEIAFREKKVIVPFEYKIEGKEGIANFKLKMSQFGIEPPGYMGVYVEDEISFTVKLPIKKVAARK
jgi:hypothetical protein